MTSGRVAVRHQQIGDSIEDTSSLAFRAFDKILLFGHWLSKTLKLALAFGAFLLKLAFTIS